MDRDVALEVGALFPLPQMTQRLPTAPAEAGVRGERDRDVEVEDLLIQPVLVERGVEEDQRDRGGHQHERERRERRQAVIP
jgi:hypothetical protein